MKHINYRIATSLFDNDWYKFLMLYYKWIFHPTASVRFETFNRTKSVKTAEIIPFEAYKEQMETAKTLSFTPEQLAFIHGQSREYFNRNILDFLSFLKSFRLPDYEIRVVDGQYKVITEGANSTLWEIPTLFIENALLLHYRCEMFGITQEQIEAEAEREFRSKLPLLRQLPPKSLLEFGTRRRASKRLQRHLYAIAQEEIGGIMTATSNPEMAMETGTPWAGTHPHEGPLLELGIALGKNKTSRAVRESQNTFFSNWWALFPYPVRVALPDTLGNVFWEDFDPSIARAGRGLRWDSGPWQEFNKNASNYYQRIGINAKSSDPIAGKDAFYSDGLDPETMLEILPSATEIFRSVLFGWGTGFTNNPGRFIPLGFKPISLVMKPTAVNGIPVAKLSSNPEKATGERETIEFLRQATSYNPEEYKSVECVY